MAPIGVACQAMARWLTTPLAASPASFQPSNPAIATGEVSGPTSVKSTAPLPARGPVPGFRLPLAYRIYGDDHATRRASRASHGGRRGDRDHANGNSRSVLGCWRGVSHHDGAEHHGSL